MGDKKRWIGLVMEDIFTDFSKDIIRCVERAVAAEKGLRLAVISGKYVENHEDDINVEAYKSVFNINYRLAAEGGLEGLVVHLGSIDESKRRMVEEGWFKEFSDIPKVLISSDKKDYVTVNYDNESGIREALGYMINVNGVTNICMLGGRDDNFEACSRKRIFIKCLKEHGIMFRPKMYEPTDMSVNTEDAAGRLLDRNPEIGAVFCVNDASAVGLYKAMARRGLVPGKDILVFAFDNTIMSGEMKPPLSSVGADGVTLGQRAVEMLLTMINGGEVHSALIPTRLYGRASFPYEHLEYSPQDILRGDKGLIYRLFDDCFYRMLGEYSDRENVDLKRLFYEIVSRMITAMNHRYISIEEFGEIGRLIDIFFDKGAMDYTDPQKLLSCINRLQDKMVVVQKMFSMNANVFINRLFLRMKDNAVYTLSVKNISERRRHNEGRERLMDFMVRVTDTVGSERGRDFVFRNILSLGMKNTALYMYEHPVKVVNGIPEEQPKYIELCCAVKEGVLFRIPEERRKCPVNMVLRREELSPRVNGFAVFPVFFRDILYGMLVCELEDDICDRGEFVAMTVGRELFLDLNS